MCPESGMHSLHRIFVSWNDPASKDELSDGILEKYRSGQYTSVWTYWLKYMKNNMQLTLETDCTLSRSEGMRIDFRDIWAASETFARPTYVHGTTVVEDLLHRTVVTTTRSNLDDALSRVTIEGLLHTVNVLDLDLAAIRMKAKIVQEYDEQDSQMPIQDFFNRRRSSTPSLPELPAELPTMHPILKELNYLQ